MADAERIRDLNDTLRQRIGAMTPQSRDVVTITQGIEALGPDAVGAIILRVQIYDHFLPEDDPYGEHNFGAFDYDDARVFWKIEYYGMALEYGSEDPADDAVTRRVLTIMLADEY